MAEMDDRNDLEINPVGDLAAAMMEVIENTYGEDAKIGVVGIVAEVEFPVGATVESARLAWSNVEQPWIQAALFEEGAKLSRGEQG